VVVEQAFAFQNVNDALRQADAFGDGGAAMASVVATTAPSTKRAASQIERRNNEPFRRRK